MSSSWMGVGSIKPSFVPRLVPGLIHLERDSLHLLLHPRRPRWVVINRFGRRIVDLCDGKRSIKDLASVTAAKYGKGEAEVEGDIIDFVGSLAKAGLLISDDTSVSGDEDSIGIRSVFLHITDRCNLNCVHCYVGDHSPGEQELPGRRIYDLIDELAQIGGRSITLSGGEPLLREDWADLVAYARQRLRVALNTNATLIDDRAADFLSGVRPEIQVSLDGPTAGVHDAIRGPGRFAATMNGIRSLKQSGLSSNVTISMTLMRTNITSAPEMLRFVRDMGIPKIRFLPLHSQGRAKSHWADLDAPRKAYLEWYRYVYYAPEARSASTEISGGLPGFLLTTSGVGAERWCSVGRSVVIDSTGEVYPCPLLMDRRFSLGNIGESSLLEIRDSKRLKGLVAACLERMEYVDKCRRCAWKGMCQAACPAHVFLKSGTLWGTDEFCEFRQCLYADRIFEVAKAKANN